MRLNISSDQYKLTWKKAETMGYSTAIPSGSKKVLSKTLKILFTMVVIMQIGSFGGQREKLTFWSRMWVNL